MRHKGAVKLMFKGEMNFSQTGARMLQHVTKLVSLVTVQLCSTPATSSNKLSGACCEQILYQELQKMRVESVCYTGICCGGSCLIGLMVVAVSTIVLQVSLNLL